MRDANAAIALGDSGGQLIMATLRSVATDPDYSLRARLTEYLAGYYNLALDRNSNISAELYREAERLYERAGDRLNLASIRNNQAYAALGRGDVETALQLYLETLELQKTSRHLEGQAHVRGRLGYLYYTIGDYRRGEVRLRSPSIATTKSNSRRMPSILSCNLPSSCKPMAALTKPWRYWKCCAPTMDRSSP